MDPTDLDAQLDLPSLDPGVTLLSMEERATGALQSLVLDHLLMNDGPAFWVDARNNAVTTTLARIAPSKRVLERIRVARAFTPFQHYSIVEDLPDAVTNDTAMIVLPDVNWFYDEDELRRGEGDEMFDRVLDTVSNLASSHELPVVVTQHPQEQRDPLDSHVDAVVECTMTKFGPRFSGSDFETLLFDCETGVQTTFAFWRRVLQARHSETLQQPSPEVTVRGAN